MQLYLLDTNISSYIIRGKMPRVREQLGRVPMGCVAVSVITEAELRSGLARKPEALKLRVAVESFLLSVTILPWNSDCAKAYAAMRFLMESAGNSISNLDLMIAAQAVVAQAILVTNDGVFRKVQNLAIEDWTK